MVKTLFVKLFLRRVSKFIYVLTIWLVLEEFYCFLEYIILLLHIAKSLVNLLVGWVSYYFG